MLKKLGMLIDPFCMPSSPSNLLNILFGCIYMLGIGFISWNLNVIRWSGFRLEGYCFSSTNTPREINITRGGKNRFSVIYLFILSLHYHV